MLYWTVVFVVVAVLAVALGFGQMVAVGAAAARILLFFFVLLLVIWFALRQVRRARRRQIALAKVHDQGGRFRPIASVARARR